MASDLKELTKLYNQVIAVDLQGKRPHDDDLRAAFRTRSSSLKIVGSAHELALELILDGLWNIEIRADPIRHSEEEATLFGGFGQRRGCWYRNKYV